MEIIIITSILIGLIFAPLGCLVLWKKYVYYGDGLAHASMLAATISVALDIPIIYAALVNSLLFTIVIYKLKAKSDNNAAIGFISSIMIASALIISYFSHNQINFDHILFGNIIAANQSDAIILSIIFFAVIAFICVSFKDLILIILSNDVAHSRGVKVQILDFFFLVILSFAIIITIKIVGALMVISMILIPAMIARPLANSPLMMIFLAALFAQSMNFFGVIFSLYLDLPFSPVIIFSGGVIYVLLLIGKSIKGNLL